MSTWHLDIDDVHSDLTEAVDEDELYLDGAWDRKYVHLEHLFDLKVEVGPADWHLVRLRNLPIIDE